MKSAVLALSVLVPSVALAATPEDCGRHYSVLAGETLGTIAQAVYGDARRYTDIYAANRAAIGASPDTVAVGTTLFLPCASEPVAETFTPVSAGAVSDLAEISPLMEGLDLLAVLDRPDVQIVDLRMDKDKLDIGFVPGAVHVPFSLWRGPKDDPGRPPTDAAVSQILSDAGLRPDLPTVLLPAKDHVMHFARASYAYWLLKSAGFERLGILDGGSQRWANSGFETRTGPARAQPAPVLVTLADTWRANALEVAAVASGQREGALIDARPEGIFRRQKAGVLVPSTLHGAQNMESIELHAATFGDEDPTLSVLSRLKEQRVDWENVPVINFCSDGTLGAVNWFYASEVVGIGNVKLFPESIRGWQGDGNPVTIGTLGERLAD